MYFPRRKTGGIRSQEGGEGVFLNGGDPDPSKRGRGMRLGTSGAVSSLLFLLFCRPQHAPS